MHRHAAALGPAKRPAQLRGTRCRPPRRAGDASLAGRSSSTLLSSCAPRAATRCTRSPALGPAIEPPLSENDPMYFVLGARDGRTARFQLSFKYRLFDLGTGFGRDQPWLSGLYFGYTQNSIWDLSSDSKAFRDTSYRPSLFWKWERADDRPSFDSVRVGLEHESNGGARRALALDQYRVRAPGMALEAGAKAASSSRRSSTPTSTRTRTRTSTSTAATSTGGALRLAAAWVATAVVRHGTSGKGSLQLDLSRRTRDLQVRAGRAATCTCSFSPATASPSWTTT